MSLLRKDLKIGFIAGDVLLVGGVGYAIFATLNGPEQAAADPPAVTTDPLSGEAIGQTDAAQPAASTTEPPAPTPSTADAWDAMYPGGKPIITQQPLGAVENSPVARENSGEALVGTPNVTDPDVEGAQIVPPGAAGADNGAPAQAASQTHVVASGDNFSSIAQKYYGDAGLYALIEKANPSIDSRRLKIGQKVLIPDRGTVQKPLPQAGTAPQGPSPAPSRVGNQAGSYTVMAGDTLMRIAEKQLGRRTMWKEIYELNRDLIGNDPAALKVGMKLKMPG